VRARRCPFGVFVVLGRIIKRKQRRRSHQCHLIVIAIVALDADNRFSPGVNWSVGFFLELVSLMESL
jgi:hypothetical protein